MHPARSPIPRILSAGGICALVVALSAGLAACGSDARSVDIESTRACLAGEGYREIPWGEYESALPGASAPNLAMANSKLTLEVTLDSSVGRAVRRSADFRGLLASVGSPEPDLRVSRVENAVAVFTPAPGAAERSRALGCLAQA